MSELTLFGFAAISIMLIAYILEDSSPVWIFIFATACIASSAYGFLAGTTPFGIVEIIWAMFAYRKWWLARKNLRNDSLR